MITTRNILLICAFLGMGDSIWLATRAKAVNSPQPVSKEQVAKSMTEISYRGAGVRTTSAER